MNNRTLILVRHAKSSWDDSTLEDHQRPLNQRGETNAPTMGIRLQEIGIIPDALFSSTAVRASSTAKIFADCLHFPEAEISFDSDLYLSSAGMLQDFVAQIDNSLNTVLIFGHNPGLTLLVSQVWRLPIGNIPTCGIVTIDFIDSDWQQASFSPPASATFDFPKNSSPPISFSDKK